MEPQLGVWNLTGEEHCSLSLSGSTFLVVAYSAVMAVGLLGNGCLVLVIAAHREMRNVTNVLIANLSCSDVLMCLVCLPVTIVYTLMDRWVLGSALCKATPFVQCISVSVSVFSLVLIAMERYQLIVHPTGWKPGMGQSYLAVVLTWVLAGLISVPLLSYSQLATPLQNLSLPVALAEQPVCMEHWPSVRHRRAYTTSLLLLQYLLPLGLISICYLHIYLRLRRRKDMVERSGGGGKSKGSARINAMLVAIVVAFALSWLPLNVFNTVFDWDHEAIPECGHDAIFSLCHLVAMASTCVNPVVYGFLNGNFQKQLKSSLLRCRCWAPPERYEAVPLSTVSTEVTRGSALSNGSIGANV